MDDLVLDSSYLFPLFGIALEYRNFDRIFPKLPEKYAVKYNPISLIEAKWYILKESRKNKKKKEDRSQEEDPDLLFQRYRTGLLSLRRDHRFESTLLTDEHVEELADTLLTKFEIRDYFDRMIYSTAAHLNCVLLTEDGTLHELFRKTGGELPRPRGITRWKDLVKVDQSKIGETTCHQR